MENIVTGNQENFKNLIESDKLSVVDFWAEWCGPCKMQLPILDNFASTNTDIQVIKINVDQNNEIAINNGIRSIPTIVYFKNGQELKRTVGLQKLEDLNKIKEELV